MRKLYKNTLGQNPLNKADHLKMLRIGSRGEFEAGAGRGRGAAEEGRLRGHAPGGDALQEPGGEERGRGGGAEGLPGGAQGRRAVVALQERGTYRVTHQVVS